MSEKSNFWPEESYGNSRKRKIYGGCRVYSPSGNLIFLCEEKKADWYINKIDEKTGQKIAIEIHHINPIIDFVMKKLSIKPSAKRVLLLFEPEKHGSHGDKYLLSKKKNRCVVTGDKNLEKLTKHHITPYCYRRFMPEEYKTANAHDIVPITTEKHHEYEREASKLKHELAKKYGAPSYGKVSKDEGLFEAIKAAATLKREGDKIPKRNQQRLKKIIRKHSGGDRVLKSTIEEYAALDPKEVCNIRTHGEVVMEKVVAQGEQAIQEFVEMWRNHFLEHAEPKYMPRHWKVNRQAQRPNSTKRRRPGNILRFFSYNKIKAYGSND
jgi:ribosomal 50S subunit-associated protein YjgA (DUF615 family)